MIGKIVHNLFKYDIGIAVFIVRELNLGHYESQWIQLFKQYGVMLIYNNRNYDLNVETRNKTRKDTNARRLLPHQH